MRDAIFAAAQAALGPRKEPAGLLLNSDNPQTFMVLKLFCKEGNAVFFFL